MTEPTPQSGGSPADYSLTDYVAQAALVIGLPIPPEYHQSVMENFARIQTVAQFVLDCPLPEDIEIAPIFEP
jgi:hypothetical protein